MQEESKGLVDLINSLWGGAIGSLIAAFVGRAMYHGQEVKAGRRKVLGWHVLWEVPAAVGMAFVGEGLAAYLSLQPPMTTALIAVLAYLGPRGSQAVIERLFDRGAK
jgi:hypothetical protein